MKRLSNWDTYVQEALKDGDRSIELPLTDDESYIIKYPSRRQGRVIARAQREADTDALLVAMLGEEPGKRVMELSEDWPAFVLDEFLIDVMKKFGMIPDVPDEDEESSEDASEDEESAEPAPTPPAASNGRAPGKSPAKRKTATRR